MTVVMGIFLPYIKHSDVVRLPSLFFYLVILTFGVMHALSNIQVILLKFVFNDIFDCFADLADRMDILLFPSFISGLLTFLV